MGSRLALSMIDYHVTGDRTYMDYIIGKDGKSFARRGTPTRFSWDDKLPRSRSHVYSYSHKLICLHYLNCFAGKLIHNNAIKCSQFSLFFFYHAHYFAADSLRGLHIHNHLVNKGAALQDTTRVKTLSRVGFVGSKR